MAKKQKRATVEDEPEQDPKATPDLKAKLPKRQCTATSRTTGNRCGQRPIPGGTVCRFHGGAAPQVRRKAEEQLQAFRDEAMETLIGIARDALRPEQYKALTWALERAGFRAGFDLNASLTMPQWQEMLQGMFAEGEAPGGRALENIVEAVVVSDPSTAPPGTDTDEWEQMDNVERLRRAREQWATARELEEQARQEEAEHQGFSEQAGRALPVNFDETPPAQWKLNDRRRNRTRSE